MLYTNTMRLDKFLCETLSVSRKEAKDYIKKNELTVNGKRITDNGFILDEINDKVFLDSKELKYEKFVYYMLNKPAGVVSATNDNTSKTVIDLLKDENKKDLFSVGRLDKDTVGLLLITNDGEFSHYLISPKHHVYKTYNVKLLKSINKEAVKKLEEGVELVGDGITKPARVEVISDHEINLSICEGMFHQVKRMLIAVDNEVVFLKRISIGNLKLDDNLKEGDYRRLSVEELDLLNKQIRKEV